MMKLKIAFLFLIIGILVLACHTTKEVEKSRKTEITKSDLDSVVKTKLDSVSKHYEEKIKEMQSKIEFYDVNEEQYNEIIEALQQSILDSTFYGDSVRNDLLAKIRAFKCPENKIIYKTDGSVEVSGKIKDISTLIKETKKSIDSIGKSMEQDIKKHEHDETDKKEVDKQIHKETDWFDWKWWLIIAAYILGCILPPMKIIHLFLNTKKQTS